MPSEERFYGQTRERLSGDVVMMVMVESCVLLVINSQSEWNNEEEGLPLNSSSLSQINSYMFENN